MNIADTTTYTIRVTEDIYYIKNKTAIDLSYSLYREDQTLSLISETTLSPLEELTIVFDGDGTYKVYIGSDIVEIRYYLKLQSTMINTIGDFLCDCCQYSTIDYDCSCSTKHDIECVQFSAIPLMMFSYQHLVDYCLNSCCAAQYLYDVANEYEYILRESYLGHIREECIKGKSLYGTKGLRYMASIYYALFLEAELEARDEADEDFIYAKFDYDRIRGCMEDLGISYDKLKEIMGLCDDRFTQIFDSLEEINETTTDTNTKVDSIQTDLTALTETVNGIEATVDETANVVEACCEPDGNTPPVANAGINQSGDTGDGFTLDGTGSFDPDGSVVSYLWSVVSSPVVVTIDTPTTATSTVTGFTAEGAYVFELKVTDNQGATDDDTVLITIGEVIPVAINSEVVDNRAGDCTADYTFGLSDFGFTPIGDTIDNIIIEDITAVTIGTLQYDSAAITTPLTIAAANIGLLVYTPDNTNTAQYVEDFSFSIETVESTTGSNTVTMGITATSCATAIAQIQLTDGSDVDLNCGALEIIPTVPEASATTTYTFKIVNDGDLALAGTIGITGTNATKFTPDVVTVNVAASGTQVVEVEVDLVGAGGSTLSASVIMTTNSDTNPICELDLSLSVTALASPPTTLASAITILRDTTCTDETTFSSTDFAYTDGSPVGRTHIRIDSLPSTGTLKFNSINVIVPQIIAEGDIGLLTYTPDGTSQGATSPTFTLVSSNDNGVTWG